MTQLQDGGRQPRNREEQSLSASIVIARWQENGWDEPCKSRGLRTVLWAAGGEIPPADPAVMDSSSKRARHVISASSVFAHPPSKAGMWNWALPSAAQRRSGSLVDRSFDPSPNFT